MADSPPDGHCPLPSTPRSGLKRELAFALRAQADLSSMGRTRSGKIRRFSLPAVPEKRRRRSGAGTDDERPDLGGGGSEDAVDDVDVGGASKGLALHETGCARSPDRRCCSSPPNPSRDSENGAVEACEVPISVEAEAVTDMSVVAGSRNELVETISPVGCDDGTAQSEMRMHVDVAADVESAVVTAGQSELVETAVPINCRYETMVVDVNDQDEPGAADVDPIISHVVASCSWNGEQLQDDNGLEAAIPSGCQDELNPDNVVVMDGTEDAKLEGAVDIGCSSETKISGAGASEPCANGGNIVSCKAQLKAGSMLNVGDEKKHAELKTPVRRFTRSLLKSLESSVDVSPAKEPKVCSSTGTAIAVDGANKANAEAVMPSRRLTRSLSKSMEDKKAEPSPLVMTRQGSESSDDFKEVQSPKVNMGVDPRSPSSATPKKKMEIKMSKKIASTKVPSNTRELLATGLLDGQTVMYANIGKNRGVLHGVISNGGICCHCSSCKGENNISAYYFEVHAGSNKKHPSKFITLENGNSLHDVIKACASAPLDMLESTIRNAASSDIKNQSVTCQQCTEVGKQLCDACLFQRLASKDQSTSGISTRGVRLNTSKGRHPSCMPAKMGRLDTSKVQDASLIRPKRGRPRKNRDEQMTSAMENNTNGRPSRSPEKLKDISSEKKSTQRKMTTKDFFLHKLVFMNDTLPDGTEVAYYTRGQRLLEGYIKGSGIFCRCCNSVVSPSTFEAHAGCAQRKKPYLNIYTSNGVSLHELSVSLSKDKTFCLRENDDLCRICAGDGDLLCCDSCPRSFHKECVGLSHIPEGNWYCPCCKNMIQRESYVAHNDNARAAGRVSGVDPIEQIFKRCIRIVQSPELDASSCVLCRCHDFSKSGFGPRTVLLCDQCEKEFHIGCLKSHNIADLEALPEGEWFCCSDCSIIYIELRKFVASGIHMLPEQLLAAIKSKSKEKCLTEELDVEVTWQLLNGKMACSDSRLLLSRAIAIFQESFDPIIDLPTGHDLIPSMVYGRDIGHQDFGGMFCAILIANKSVVSVGLLRVLGRDVAELPLVATTKESQGNGYFQTLFSCIERLLISLDVKHLVLPATKEALEIWTRRFGFCEITQNQLEEYTKGSRPMSFQGTPMLHKPVTPIKETT